MHRSISTVCAALLVSHGAAAQAVPADDPFSGFEHHTLSNGMHVWLRVLPGARDVSVGVVVPYGSDRDPVGKEETAHYLEHVLFSDHAGRTEQEIKEEVESRGGERNGFTAADHTFYYVTTPSAHGLFGIDWLARIVEPHDMDPDVVERNRQPVALEIGARPRQLPERVASWLDPPWLHRPGFWAREFGLETRSGRRYDRWASLQAIGPEDLRAFYDRYYVPERMTLVVVGAVSRDRVLAHAEAGFGTLTPRPAPPGDAAPLDPGRADRTVAWTVRHNIRYQRIFKIYDMDRDRHLRLLFLSRLLDRRLTARLRFGETKAVYGIGVGVVQRGPAAYLSLDAPIDPDRFDFARDGIEEELEALADARDVPRFEADRAALVERLVAENRNAQDLLFWAYRAFYRPEIHPTFPDVARAFATVSPEEVAAEVRALLDPERQVLAIVRPHPLPQALLGVAVMLLGLLALRGARALLITPVRMSSIRYVARLRASPALFPLLAALWLALGAVVALAGFALGSRAAYALVVPVDSYPLHLGMWGAVIVAGVALAVLWLALPPRKLLVFEDHVRVKHLAYRSRVLPFHALERVRVVHAAELARRRPSWRTLPMALGLTGPVLHLQPKRGWGYLARVRRPDELLEVLRAAGAPVEDAPGPREDT